MLAASPREDSGSQARRRSEEAGARESADEEEVGRSSRAGFCCRSAM
jgi:hypothetical protein